MPRKALGSRMTVLSGGESLCGNVVDMGSSQAHGLHGVKKDPLKSARVRRILSVVLNSPASPSISGSGDITAPATPGVDGWFR